jgi:hypothetical protein
MRIFTNLLFKVTLSSMIITAPAMITKGIKNADDRVSAEDGTAKPYSTSVVIKRFFNYNNLTPKAVYTVEKGMSGMLKTAALSAEVKMVVNEADILYNDMDLEDSGLDERAFEYAWRGYYNLLKRGLIRKKNVLSICDFSQSACSRRMYVIDLRHKKLLYRTFVAHGQNSGTEYADSFSNEPESFKSSLGFYVTQRTYYGHNGLSLRISGVDTGYNDKASQRNIVLHGSYYVDPQYMENNGTIGTSLGCPAIPTTMGPRIIRAVKNGSCIFIYHPTPKYLQESTVING